MMKNILLWFITGTLFVGFGYNHCPGAYNKNFSSFQYALNIVIWPIPVVAMMIIKRECK